MKTRSPRRKSGYLDSFWSNSAYIGFLLTASLFTAACLIFPVIIPAVATIGWFSFNIMTALVGARLTLAVLSKMNVETESKIARIVLLVLGFAIGFAAGLLGLHFMPLLPYIIVTLSAAGLVLASAGAGVVKTVVSVIQSLFGFNKIKLEPTKVNTTVKINTSGLTNLHEIDQGKFRTNTVANSSQYKMDLSSLDGNSSFDTAGLNAAASSISTTLPQHHADFSTASTTTAEPSAVSRSLSTTSSLLTELSALDTAGGNKTPSPTALTPTSNSAKLLAELLDDGISSSTQNTTAPADNPPPLLSEKVAEDKKQQAAAAAAQLTATTPDNSVTPPIKQSSSPPLNPLSPSVKPNINTLWAGTNNPTPSPTSGTPVTDHPLKQNTTLPTPSG